MKSIECLVWLLEKDLMTSNKLMASQEDNRRVTELYDCIKALKGMPSLWLLRRP